MRQALTAIHILFAVIAVFGIRWAYGGYLVTALLALPSRTGFQLERPQCETTTSLYWYAMSLTKVGHIILFGIFFLITLMQFRVKDRRAIAWSFLASLIVGLIVELEETATRTGNCRMRDLLPDAAGAVLAAILFLVVRESLRKARIQSSGD